VQNSSATRDLCVIRLDFFLWIGAGGFLSPFVTLFYKARYIDRHRNWPAQYFRRYHRHAGCSSLGSLGGRFQAPAPSDHGLLVGVGLVGIVNTVGALFEVPFMLLADRLIQWHGSGRILGISMLVQAGSFLSVVLFSSIPSFFILRIMASIALGLNVPSYYSYLVESAPQGQGGTVVSHFDVTLRSGVSLLAAPLAGILFDNLGAYWLYIIGMAGHLLAWLILQVLAHPHAYGTV